MFSTKLKYQMAAVQKANSCIFLSEVKLARISQQKILVKVWYVFRLKKGSVKKNYKQKYGHLPR